MEKREDIYRSRTNIQIAKVSLASSQFLAHIYSKELSEESSTSIIIGNMITSREQKILTDLCLISVLWRRRKLQCNIYTISVLFVLMINVCNFEHVLQHRKLKINQMVFFITAQLILIKRKRYWWWQWWNNSLFEERFVKICRFKSDPNREVWKSKKLYNAGYRRKGVQLQKLLVKERTQVRLQQRKISTFSTKSHSSQKYLNIYSSTRLARVTGQAQ